LLTLKGVTLPELNIIEQSTQLIMNIIRNILDKMQKERNPETAEIHINELLESELTFLNANAFFKHEVAKKYQYADDLPAIPGVYSDFSQALMNIVYNAIDAMKDSDVKELKVKTIHDENRNLVRISITDTGPGIRDEHRNEIFKPFFTTKRQEAEGETQTDLSSGSGLGLSSSVALLKPYGGTITFETGVGKGTTFQVSIPIKPPEIRA
jgi:signal transduction histidine kinase